MPDITLGAITLGAPFWDAVFGVGLLLLFGVLTWVANLVLRRIGRGLARRINSPLGHRLIHAVSRPLLVLVFLQGVFLAVSQIGALSPWDPQIRAAWGVAFVGLIAIAAARLV